MDKPLTIIIRETQQSMLNVINSSGLPIDITRMILKELYEVANEQANEVYAKDVEAYNKAQNDNGTQK